MLIILFSLCYRWICGGASTCSNSFFSPCYAIFLWRYCGTASVYLANLQYFFKLVAPTYVHKASFSEHYLFIAARTALLCYIFRVDPPTTERLLSYFPRILMRRIKPTFVPVKKLSFETNITDAVLCQYAGIPCVAVACYGGRIFVWEHTR